MYEHCSFIWAIYNMLHECNFRDEINEQHYDTIHRPYEIQHFTHVSTTELMRMKIA